MLFSWKRVQNNIFQFYGNLGLTKTEKHSITLWTQGHPIIIQFSQLSIKYLISWFVIIFPRLYKFEVWTNIRPNKTKVLVLRQCCPLKISADCDVKKSYFEKIKNKIKSNLPPNLSFQACRWCGRVLTIVWMTDQSETKIKIRHGYEWKHCPRQF